MCESNDGRFAMNTSTLSHSEFKPKRSKPIRQRHCSGASCCQYRRAAVRTPEPCCDLSLLGPERDGTVSGVEVSSLTLRASIGEVMFVAAGMGWLYTYSKIVSLLVMTGLIVAVTTSVASARKA